MAQQKRRSPRASRPRASTAPSGTSVKVSSRPDVGPGRDADMFAEIQRTINEHHEALIDRPDVLSVRPGYQFTNGWITARPAIVVTVLEKSDRAAATASLGPLPQTLDSYPVDVAPATPMEQLAALEPAQAARLASVRPESVLGTFVTGGAVGLASVGDIAVEALPKRKYVPPPNLSLDPVTGPMKITCHVSPDAGWPTLSAFLEQTKKSLTVAMYDFTAPHIASTLVSSLRKAPRRLTLVLDPGETLGAPGHGDNPKADDEHETDIRTELEDALATRFKFRWAAVTRQGKTTGGLFPSAYHIKVAVRDGSAFWLSSGNWQSSNQPDIDPIKDDGPGSLLGTYNREWHVVVEHPGLARLFERFINYDYQQAADYQAGPDVEALPDLLLPELIELEAIPEPEWRAPTTFTFTASHPVRVQPLLTPDNYAELVIALLKRAERRLYFMNQYIKIGVENAPAFTELLDELLAATKRVEDPRIILRNLPDTRAQLEAMQAYGFDMDHVRLMKTCHTKGIVVDSDVVCVGSHNWSNHGTVYNRDASLIIEDQQVTEYYASVFAWDWDHLARQSVLAESAMPLVVTTGMRRVPWSAFDED